MKKIKSLKTEKKGRKSYWSTGWRYCTDFDGYLRSSLDLRALSYGSY